LLVVISAPVLLLFAKEAWAANAVTASRLGFGAAASIRAVHRHCPTEIDRRSVALFVPPLWGFCQYATGATAHRTATLTSALEWTAAAALFVAARSIFSDLRVRRKSLNLALIFGTLVAIASLVGYGPFPNRNHHAAFVELILPLAVVRAVEERRTPLILAVALLTGSVLLGGSRAGIALVGVELIVLLNGGRRRWAAIGAGLVAATALWAHLGVRDDGNRIELYQSTVEMIGARPLVGNGLGAYESVYPAHAFFDNGLIVDHAHNDWLEWVSEIGVIGVLPLLAVAIWAGRESLRQPWALGAAAVFVHALVDYPLHKPALLAWLMVFLAAMVTGKTAAARRVRS